METTIKKDENINYQFKILYALGIFFVVVGHLQSYAFSVFYEFFPPYGFHMGLFVFCSGYFYKESAEKDIERYVKKKLKTLIIPMYLWNCFYALFAQIMTLGGVLFWSRCFYRKTFIYPYIRWTSVYV